MIGFTKTWSRELGPGRAGECSGPGFIATIPTGHHPRQGDCRNGAPRALKRRLGKPEEIANAYAFLASDEASYINGAVLEVAGGMTV